MKLNYYLLRADDGADERDAGDSIAVVAIRAREDELPLTTTEIEERISGAVSRMSSEVAMFRNPTIFHEGMDDNGLCGWIEEVRFDEVVYWSIFFMGTDEPESIILY